MRNTESTVKQAHRLQCHFCCTSNGYEKTDTILQSKDSASRFDRSDLDPMPKIAPKESHHIEPVPLYWDLGHRTLQR